MENITIYISEEFGKLLGARYTYEGPFSGELFLNDFLRPRFLDAQQKEIKLEIFLDGVRGYPSSFVSGSFGKLSLEYGAEAVIDVCIFHSNNSLRVEKIINEIKNPKKKNEVN